MLIDIVPCAEVKDNPPTSSVGLIPTLPMAVEVPGLVIANCELDWNVNDPMPVVKA